MRARAICGSSFVLAAHGDAVAPPAAPLRDHLLERGAARVTFVVHPLSPEEGDVHTVYQHEASGRVRRRSRRLPTRIPYTYPLDVLWPGSIPPSDAWFGFNNLLAARGLVERRRGRTARTAYWAVDFVPDRFGPGPLTAVYDRFDHYCAHHVDLRIEISRQSLQARDARLVLDGTSAPSVVVGIGAFVERAPKVPADAHRARRAVFIGHLVERMGVTLALDALELLIARDAGVHLDIAGRGPQEDELRGRVAASALRDHVTFHGFIDDHAVLERLLATASVGLAPYVPHPDSFTRFADPSKLKSYLAAGLPIVLTDVPPSAGELADEAGAEVVPYEAEALARAIEGALADPAAWTRRRAAAIAYAQRFEWSTVLAPALAKLGFNA
jgi:glycosyltransferase involved in cell wall biosynthesis